MEELSLSFGLGKVEYYLKSQVEVKVEQSECPFIVGQMIVEWGTGKHCTDPIL